MKSAEHEEPTPHEVPALPAGHWLSVDDVSACFGIDRITVIRLYRRGHLPGVKVGGSYRLLAAFIRELLARVHAGHGVDVETFSVEWAMRATSGNGLAFPADQLAAVTS